MFTGFDTLTWVQCSTLSSILRPAHSFPSPMSAQFIELPSTECELGSVVGIATGYGLDGPGIEFPVGARFSAPVQTNPPAYPASCTLGTGSFQGVKSGRGVALTPLPPSLVLWSRKSIAIPLLPLWAVQPVQKLSACTVQLYLYYPYGPYGLYRASVPVQYSTAIPLLPLRTVRPV
jgi:hypothetical protein